MIKVTLGTTTTRKEYITKKDQIIKDFLDEHNVIITNELSIKLDGMNLDEHSLNRTFDDFDLEDECMLVVVVNSKNA